MTDDPAPRQIKRFGWRPDLPDFRDYTAPRLVAPAQLPAEFDLRENPATPPIKDQGQLGSCTGFGNGTIANFALAEAGIDLQVSELAIYYGERQVEHEIHFDSGAQVRDGLKVMSRHLIPESDWPYDISKFDKRPSAKAYKDGREHKVTRFSRVPQTELDIKASIFAKRPVVFGFTVYESFESIGSDGIMPVPSPAEAVIGGHCVVKWGWTLIHGATYWVIPNSWGEGWGDHGYFYMPMGYSLNPNLASDFWCIEEVA